MTMLLIISFGILFENNVTKLIPDRVADSSNYRLCNNNIAQYPYKQLFNIPRPEINQSFGFSKTEMTVRDSLRTIWLPLPAGGVISPGQIINNPNNDHIYVIGGGRNTPNIAVCDAQSGRLESIISTSWTPSEFAYSEMSNKLYCAVSDSNKIIVIDCQNNQPIRTIRLFEPTNALFWLRSSNEIYCNQSGNHKVSVINCTNDSLIINIPVGRSPGEIASSNYPLSHNVYCESLDTLYVIDANNHNVIKRIKITSGPHFFTFNTLNNKVYCVNIGNNIVDIIDGAGDTLITSVPIGDVPMCAAYNSVTNDIYIGHAYSNDIYILDGNTDSIIGNIDFIGPVCSMAYDSIDNRLFITTEEQMDENNYADLVVIDGSSNAIIDTLTVGVLPCFRASILWEKDFNQVWVCNSGFDNLPGYTVTGCAADSLTHCFTTAVGFTPFSAVLNPTTSKYYCIGRADKYIAIFNISNPDSCIMKETGDCAWDVLYNPLENKIYCANSMGRNVSILDGSNDSILAQVRIVSDPLALALNKTDNKIFVSSYKYNEGSGYITIIDGHTNAILDTIPIGIYPFSMLWNPIDNKLYVASYHGQSVTIIDAHADTVLATISSNGYPWALVRNTVNDKIYCSNDNTKTTMIIDGSTNALIDTINTGYFPYTFTYNPLNNKVYCGNRAGRISVINGENDSLINNIVVPGNPYSMLYNPITNTVFCAYVNQSIPFPYKDAVMILDGASDAILADFIIESQVWISGVWGGINSPSTKALLLDSINNNVYLTHYSSSKISVIDGATGICERTAASPRSIFLQIAPNPMKNSAMITLSLPRTKDVHLALYDITGRMIDHFNIPNVKEHKFIWRGCNSMGLRLPCGIYFMKMAAGNYIETKKIIIIE